MVNDTFETSEYGIASMDVDQDSAMNKTMFCASIKIKVAECG